MITKEQIWTLRIYLQTFGARLTPTEGVSLLDEIDRLQAEIETLKGALESIAVYDKIDASTVQYWDSFSIDEMREVCATDTLIAREVLEKTE